MKIRNLLCFMFGLMVIFSTSVQAGDPGGIMIKNAWVQAGPPSETNTVAYMTIMNNSSNDIVVTSASADIAGATEIHRMTLTNGMMKMNKIDSLKIPAKSMVKLRAAHYHLMLINLKKPVNPGDSVPIKINFLDGSSMVVKALVKSIPQDSSSMPGMKM